MSNHNITTAIRWLVISIVVFVLGAFTMSGIQAFMEDEQATSTPSSFLTARLEMPEVPPSSSTEKGQLISVDGHKVFVRRDCGNKMTDETARLYGPLAEQIAYNGLEVTVPQGSSVWRELELAVLSAQIGAEDASIRNFDHWTAEKAQTRPERERITANLLETLRRQEGDSLAAVPANYKVALKALRPDKGSGAEPPREHHVEENPSSQNESLD